MSDIKSALGILFVIVIVGYVIFGEICRTLGYKAVADNPVLTRGKVIKKEYSHLNKDFMTCSFDANGKTYLATGSPTPPNPITCCKAGDSVILYYAANTPRCAVFGNPKTAYDDELLAVSFWGTAVVLSIGYSLYRYRTPEI